MAPGQHAPHPFVGLAFLVLVQLSLFIGITVFTVQLPDIMRDLNIQQGTAEMTITIYLALPPALLVTMGQLADRRGRRHVLFIGAAVMIASSLLGGISWNGEILILARLLQGIAYAMLLTTAVALINVMFTEPRDRGIAFGMLAASLGVGFSVGPLLGGFFAQEWSWRWSFFFNIPVMLLVVIGSWWSVPESKSTRQTGPLDLPGTALLGTGLLSLVVALSQGRTYGWLRPHESFVVAGWHWPYSFSFVSLLLAAAVILLILFVSYERSRTRWTQSVLMDFELFRLRRFTVGCVTSFVSILAAFPIIVVLPIYLHAVLHYSPIQMGLAMVGFGVGMALLAMLAAPLGTRFSARNAVLAGLLILTAGLLTMIPTVSAAAGGWLLQLTLFVSGAGWGLTTGRINEITLVDVPPDKSGLAGGMLFMFRLIAAPIGAAVLTVALMGAAGPGAMNDVLDRSAIADHERVPSMPAPTTGQPPIPSFDEPADASSHASIDDSPLELAVEEAKNAYVYATRLTLGLATAFAGLSLLVALAIPKDTEPA